MRPAVANRLGFDVGAFVFPTVAAARAELTLSGDVHSATGGFARRVDNVFILVTPWANGGMRGTLRSLPSSVQKAITQLQSG
jgi:hypothetical protein